MGIKQGDQYYIPITITSDGNLLNINDVETVEIAIGNLIKKYPDTIYYDDTENCFLFPVSQNETFAFRAGNVKMDLRVKFKNQTVVGLQKLQNISVPNAISGEVL